MGEHVNQYQEISNWVVNLWFVNVLMCWLWLFGCDLLICVCCHVIYALKHSQNATKFFYCNLINNWSVSSVGTENQTELTETELGRYRVFWRTDRYRVSWEPNFLKNRRTDRFGSVKLNAQAYWEPLCLSNRSATSPLLSSFDINFVFTWY